MTTKMMLRDLERKDKTVTIGKVLRDYQQRNPPGIVERPAEPKSDANPKCKKCNGFGWVQSEQYGGNWFVCACTNEIRQKFLDGMLPKIDYARIGLRADEIEFSWSLVKKEIESDGYKALEVVRPAYERGHGLIFLWGNYGQAKTLIGKILTATAFRDGKRAAYSDMSSVIDDIRLAFDAQEHKSTELARRMEYWISRDVLFIDELDKSNDTKWAQERMFKLLDQRYARAIREEALTVIASNQSDDELDGYLKSRLSDARVGPVVYLNGMDGRQLMPKGIKY